jgi:hypothetical protein
VNNKVIRGTPLINSIKTTQIDFIMGIFDRLPRAKTILSGNASPIPVTPRKRVTNKPPHLLVSTIVRLGPPYNKK